MIAGHFFSPPLHVYAKLDSTNAQLRRLSNTHFGPLAVAAYEQTEGQGRRGSPWYSPATGSFSVSFSLPPLAVQKSGYVQMAVGLALLACLRSLGDAAKSALSLKWPNDIVSKMGKVAGLILESRAKAGQINELRVGIGVNLQLDEEKIPDELRPLIASLGALFDTRITFDQMLNQFYAVLLPELHKWYSAGFPDIRQNWLANTRQYGRQISFHAADGKIISGVFKDVDIDGCLILERDNIREKYCWGNLEAG
jgi:BirA family biotin operon repressor/biotin-[acetyl-CoA-carboxylase] ligase